MNVYVNVAGWTKVHTQKLRSFAYVTRESGARAPPTRHGLHREATLVVDGGFGHATQQLVGTLVFAQIGAWAKLDQPSNCWDYSMIKSKNRIKF